MGNRKTFLLILFAACAVLLCAGCREEPQKPDERAAAYISIAPDGNNIAYVFGGKLYVQKLSTPFMPPDFKRDKGGGKPGEELSPEREIEEDTPRPIPELKSREVGGIFSGKYCWSEDGRHIYFTQIENGNCDIFVYELVSGETRRLAANDACDKVLAVTRGIVRETPEAIGIRQNLLYFLSDRGGEEALWALNLDAERFPPKKLFETRGGKTVISADGTRCALIRPAAMFLDSLPSIKKEIIFWQDGKETAKYELELDNIRSAVFAGGNNSLAFLLKDRFALYRFGPGKAAPENILNIPDAQAFAIAPDGGTIAVLDKSGKILVAEQKQKNGKWQVARPVLDFSTPAIKTAALKPESLCFLPGGRRVAVSLLFPVKENGPEPGFIVFDLDSGRFESFAKDGPDPVPACLYLLALDENKLVVRTLEEAIATRKKLQPEILARTAHLLWEAYIRTGDINEAGKLATRFDMLREIGDLEFFIMKKYGRARDTYAEAERTGDGTKIPDLALLADPDIIRNKKFLKYYATARGESLKGNFKKAFEAFYEAGRYVAKMRPELEAECYFRAGQEAEKAGEIEQAVRFYDIVPEIRPWHLDAYKAKLRIFTENPAGNDIRLETEYRNLMESSFDDQTHNRYMLELVRYYSALSSDSPQAVVLIDELRQKIMHEGYNRENIITAMHALDIIGFGKKGNELFELLCRQKISLRLEGKEYDVPLDKLLVDSLEYMPEDAAGRHDPALIPMWLRDRAAAYIKSLPPDKFAPEIRFVDSVIKDPRITALAEAFHNYSSAAKGSPVYAAIAQSLAYYICAGFYKAGNWDGLVGFIEKADTALRPGLPGSPVILQLLSKEDPEQLKRWLAVFFENPAAIQEKNLTGTEIIRHRLAVMFDYEPGKSPAGILRHRKEMLFKFIIDYPQTPLLEEALFRLGGLLNALSPEESEDHLAALRLFERVAFEYPDGLHFCESFRAASEGYRRIGRAEHAFLLAKKLLPIQQDDMRKLVLRANKMIFLENDRGKLSLISEEIRGISELLKKTGSEKVREQLTPREFESIKILLGNNKPE